MKRIQFIMPLFTPDIMEYINGRDVVCRLVLNECKLKAVSSVKTISLKSRLFTDISFSEGEIFEVLSKAGKQLRVSTDYKILNKLEENSTIEDLATQLWKYVCRVVKNN
ncbi:MAG: hypothetical protein JSS98_13135 [Bacteroidetes bacterium]|nr:hypothetical protein [Bacteroidota bacterium]